MARPERSRSQAKYLLRDSLYITSSQIYPSSEKGVRKRGAHRKGRARKAALQKTSLEKRGAETRHGRGDGRGNVLSTESEKLRGKKVGTRRPT